MVHSLKSRTYAIVDTETTGMSPAHGGIIEIGILRVEDGRVVKKYHSLIRPERRISHVIMGITGISNEELENAPTFDQVSEDIREMLDGAVFVAHNARFDYAFIKAEFARIEQPYRAKTLCSVKLSRALYPLQARHNLDEVMAAHGIACANRHRAMDDAQVVWEFLRSAEKGLGTEALRGAIDRALKSNTLPSQLSREVISAIPNRPGVYIFYAADGEVLYVGKSVTLRTRVLSHFSNDHASAKEMRMCQDTADIEYRETSGELGALFLESKLVKELLPTYNRVLRKHKQLALIVSRATAEGYTAADVEYRSEIEAKDFNNILGVCRTRAQAKAFLRSLAKEKGLCGKLLGLEKGGGACWGRQLEWCAGACTGAETPASYNKRVAAAFARYKIKSWPFKGAIVVRDENDEGEGTAYVVNQWCLVETVEYAEGEVSSQRHEVVFDLDSYKILSRFLLNGRRARGTLKVEPYETPFTQAIEVY
ncbi:MAG: polC [Candidatus Adlerbacteria bacterium]|nr:polC [Candidatus Adlerbacteria bacterium]